MTAKSNTLKHLRPVLMSWSVWEFRGVTVPQPPSIVARPTEPTEIEHEYQRVLARVDAYSAKDALTLYRS